ncbi:MAG: PKD domain-containing protein [Bacteroidota bacterium]
MRISNLLFITAFTFALGLSSQAQDILCPDIACGLLNASFDTDGAVVFCEGETITLNNFSDPGFDYFIVDWQDGTIDSVTNYDPISHTYINIFQDSCEMGISFAVAFRGILACDDGFSCASGTYDFSLRPPVKADFGTNENQVCAGDPVSFTNLGCNGTGYEWVFGDGDTSTVENPDHTFEDPGIYQVTLTATGFCNSDEAVTSIEVVAPIEPQFNTTNLSSDSTACVNDEITFSRQSDSTNLLSWSILPADGNPDQWVFTEPDMDDQSEEITVRFLQAGNYTVALTGSNACGTATRGIDIQVQEPPSINLSPPDPACERAIIQLSDLNLMTTGTATNFNWTFTNGQPESFSGLDFGSIIFDQSGVIALTVDGRCGMATEEVNVDVQPRVNPQLIAEPTYCSGSSIVQLQALPGGGSWSGPGIVDASQGLFDPGEANLGDNQIQYILATGPCLDTSTIEIEIIPSELVSVTDETLCEDGGSIQLQYNPTGGDWSGPGIVDPQLGIFDPAQTGPGIHRPLYSYLDANGCTVETRPDIEVIALPQITPNDAAQACLIDSLLSLQALGITAVNPTGGTFFWTSAGGDIPGGLINPVQDLASAGIYTFNFTYDFGPCSIDDAFDLEIIEEPTLILSPQEPSCINDGTLQLIANLEGGTWSGPGVSPLTGQINLAQAGSGSFVYSYEYAAGTSCVQTASQTITIIDPSSGLVPGPEQEICEGVAQTITLIGANPEGGQWTGPGVTDPEAGLVDLSLLEPGQTYDYTYTIQDQNAADCPASVAKSLTYHPEPDPTYIVDGGQCLGDTFQLVPNQQGPEFTYLWDLGDNTTTDAVNPIHSYDETGIFFQTFTITSAVGCQASSTRTVSVVNPPAPAFTLLDREGCAPFTIEITDQSSGFDIQRLWCIGPDTVSGPAPEGFVIDGVLVDTWVPVELKASNQCGTNVARDSVLVKPYPRVNFGFETPNGCSPFTPEISNVTIGQPQNYFWDMGNGVTGIDSIPPLATYTTPPDEVTTYEITLIAFNECGSDTLTREINVFPPDVEAFIELDTIAGCPPYDLQPTSFSTPGASLNWSIFAPNDELIGTASTLSPEFSIEEPGIYTIVLEAARCGSDLDTAYFELYPSPAVSFTSDPSGCQGAFIDFANTSPASGGVLWDFGDDETGTQDVTQHAYDQAGTYEVNMTVFAPITGCPNTATGTVEVLPLPMVSFEVPNDNGCGPLTVNFANETSQSDSLEYFWDFGDGSNPSRDFAPQHIFINSGSYQVQLTATDLNGCVNSATFDSVIVHPDPVAAFSFTDSTLCLGVDQLNIIDQSSDVSAAFWNWDGQVFPGLPPVVSADALGEFSIGLTVESFFGCRDSIARVFSVLPVPEGSIELNPAEVCLGEPISYTAVTTNADGYLWDLGDETGSTETALVHYYAQAGEYTLNLVASNSNGCPSDTAFAEVIVHPNPTARFEQTLASPCGTPAEVQIENNSDGALSYLWFYGDGRSSGQFAPTVIYDSIGFYELSLIATTDFGCQDTTRQTVQVRGLPVADFTPPPVLACSPYRLQVNANPTQATRYEWTINGTGPPSVGSVLDTLLNSPGNYDLRLIAIFDEQCRDTLSRFNLFELREQPQADFDWDEDPLPDAPGDVRMINLSIAATDYFWDFGDGTTSTEIAPEHVYLDPGPRQITLTAFARYPDGLVCQDEVTQEVIPAWLDNFFLPTAMAPEAIGGEFREFGPKGLGVSEYVLEVFSPYGQLVFQTSEMDEDQPTGRWDGTYPGSERLVLQGAYTWRARVVYLSGNIENLVGTVTVIR